MSCAREDFSPSLPTALTQLAYRVIIGSPSGARAFYLFVQKVVRPSGNNSILRGIMPCCSISVLDIFSMPLKNTQSRVGRVSLLIEQYCPQTRNYWGRFTCYPSFLPFRSYLSVSLLVALYIVCKPFHLNEKRVCI